MVGVLGGLDALVFTGGIGEHSPEVRQAATAGLSFAGLRLDEAANEAPSGDAIVTAAGSAVHVLVVGAREDLTVLAEVRRLLD
jgi:acetate kinase